MILLKRLNNNVVSSVEGVAGGVPFREPSRAGVHPMRVARPKPAVAVEVQPVALSLELSAEIDDPRFVLVLPPQDLAVHVRNVLMFATRRVVRRSRLRRNGERRDEHGHDSRKNRQPTHFRNLAFSV
ncbi:hypothetical protein C4585_02565 [Candidatus Parcubacteria bacterium]|nr:MAG: hypothetical protein C4585_02565 [Candidatus Parcubacteria bacterium]